MELLARTCHTERMNVERILARAFVLVGGVLWVFMAWGAQWAYRGAPITQAMGSALIYVVGIAIVFGVGLFYEYVASALLTAGAIAIVVLGLVSGWEAGVWGIGIFFFVLPMLIAAALYAAAARMQRICTTS